MEDTKPRKFYPFEFHGKAGEFFRIWIVNLALTIVTLGIYSAWAKVRTKRYFYGNTFLDNSAFDYTADPVKILKGRILAVILLIAYDSANRFFPDLAGITFLVFVAAVPAIVVLALTFRMRYSSWRGISFRFERDFKTSYLIFILPILYFACTVLTPILLGLDAQTIEQNAEENAELSAEMTTYFSILGFSAIIAMLLFPWWQKLYYQFIGNRSFFGQSRFRFIGAAAEFYTVYFATFLVFLGGLAAMAAGVFIFSLILPKDSPAMAPLTFLLVMIPYIMAAAYLQANRTNVIYSNLELADMHFTSELKTGKMAYLYATNTLAIVLSLGMAIPWAMIRMAHYRAETIQLCAQDFNAFESMLAAEENAQAEEISEFFDIDIGL